MLLDSICVFGIMILELDTYDSNDDCAPSTDSFEEGVRE